MKYSVHVKAGSKKGPLVESAEDGSLTVFVRERAVDGKANEAVIALVARHFQIAKSSITIKSGQTSKVKRIQIS